MSLSSSSPSSSSSSSSPPPPPLLSPHLSSHYASHSLPSPALSSFLTDQSKAPHRYVRLNPRHSFSQTLTDLRAQTGSSPIPVPWLPPEAGFYAIPSECRLKNLEVYEKGRLSGMDVTSGAAVVALSLPSGAASPVRVLDLCCCPGAKLAMIVDGLGEAEGAEVVGVDVSESRMHVCRKMVKKYCCSSSSSSSSSRAVVRLYRGDGAAFDPASPSFSSTHELVFDSRAEALESNAGERKKMNKSARAREKRRLRDLSLRDLSSLPPKGSAGGEELCELFDYVLVDAECSTDGAVNTLRHKLKASAAAASLINVANEKEEEIADLQRHLLLSG